MKHRIDGPIPVFLTHTDTGRPAIDISGFLARAVFPAVFEAADADTSDDSGDGFGSELADMHGLAVSAQHQGNDSHARHEFDDRMDKYLSEFAAGGLIELSTAGLRQLRDAIDVLLAPRSIPGQRDRRSA